MKLKDILTPSFTTLRQQLGLPEEVKPMLQVSTDSDFCRTTMERGWLTKQQMTRAAERYRLGRSKSGRCIFWMIDDQGHIRDGHIGDSWASAMMKQREPILLKDWNPTHCLFGLHIIPHTSSLSPPPSTICLVESEKSAVLLSELSPDHIWMATVYPMNAGPSSFEPLRGYHVVMFPHTDETMSNYVWWQEQVEQLRSIHHLNISLNDILELLATPDQKRRRIDYADFLLEI